MSARSSGAGVRAHPVVEQLGVPLRDGRIDVDAYCRVRGSPNVWAIGDAAAVPDPVRKGQACPPTAQHALRQRRTVARNVAAALGTGRARPFRYRTLGLFVDLGRHQAVASTLGLRWRGFPAWFAARTYHMSTIPGVQRRLRLIADWTAGLLFPRSPVELGQLGHPPRLDEPALTAQSAGWTRAGDGATPDGRFEPAANGAGTNGAFAEETGERLIPPK